jgi:hypothetical protein
MEGSAFTSSRGNAGNHILILKKDNITTHHSQLTIDSNHFTFHAIWIRINYMLL